MLKLFNIFFFFLSLTLSCAMSFFSIASLSLSLSHSQTTIHSRFHLLDYHRHRKPQIPFLGFTLLPLLHHHNQHLWLTVTLNLSLKLSMRWYRRSNTANRSSLATNAASSTFVFQKFSTKCRRGQRCSKIETTWTVWGSISESVCWRYRWLWWCGCWSCQQGGVRER